MKKYIIAISLNSHCCRGYCIKENSKASAGDPVSQFPLLQGLLHLYGVEGLKENLYCLNSHCCRGYCIPSEIRGLPSCET